MVTGKHSANGNGNGRSAAKRGQIVDADEGAPGGYDADLDGGYNPADFIIPGQDHQGHSERIFCRVQPQHARAMNLVFRNKVFPFRTEGDLFRWCVVRGLRVLDKLEPQPGFMGMAEAISEVLRQEMYQQEFSALFAQMEKVIAAHIAAGSEKEARKLIAVILRQIRSTEAEENWMARSEKEVLRRFGHLVETSRGRQARLTANEEDR